MTTTTTTALPEPKPRTTPPPSHAASDAAARGALHAIVATPSLSGHERPAVELFAQIARTLGMHASIDDAGSAHAVRGADPSMRATDLSSGQCIQANYAKEIVLLGHIDTVPGDLPVFEQANTLHGRGSVDAKGPLMAMLFAAARAQLTPGIAIRVIAAVGEEIPGSPGASHVAQMLRPAACIIGEPSGWDGVTMGYKGTLVCRAHTQRHNAHTAGPDPSAPDDIHAWWSAILARIAELNAHRPGIFEQVQSGLRSLTSANDGMTDSAAITAGFRVPTWLSPADLANHLRGVTLDHIEVEFTCDQPAHRSDRNDAVVRALTSAIRAEGARPHPKLKTGTADISIVAPVWKCPIAAYGPGDSLLDHTPEERIDLDEYTRAIRVLERAIESLSREIAAGTPAL